MKTRLRIIDDIADTDKTVEIDRSRSEIIDHLIFIVHDIRRSKQKLVRACLHITKQTITVHFWTESPDLVFAREVCGVGSIPYRAIEMLRTGEEEWV
jgi:hypothetical protein